MGNMWACSYGDVIAVLHERGYHQLAEELEERAGKAFKDIDARLKLEDQKCFTVQDSKAAENLFEKIKTEMTKQYAPKKRFLWRKNK